MQSVNEIVSILYKYQGSNGKYYLDIDNDNLTLNEESYWHKFKSLFTSEADNICKFLTNNASLLSNYENSLLQAEKFQEAIELKSAIGSIYSSAGKEIPILDKGYFAEWMHYLPENAKNVKITELTLPGTHDSAAYKVDMGEKLSSYNHLGNDFLKYVGILPGFIGNEIEDKTIDWTITQHQTIKGQLESGVRYLDLRVAYNPNTDKFYGAHTFLTDELGVMLNDIKSFMKEHPEEVLVINLSREWENRGEFNADVNKVNRVMNEFKTELGSLLYNKTWSGQIDNNITINNMVNSGHRILTFSSDFVNSDLSVYSKNAFLWDGKVYNSLDKTTISNESAKIQEFTNGLNKFNESTVNTNQFNTISLCLTPDGKSVVESFLHGNTTLHDYEQDTNQDLSNFLAMHPEKLNGISVVAADFPEETSLIATIVEANHLRFDNNATFVADHVDLSGSEGILYSFFHH